MKQGKIWGETEEIFDKNNTEVHHLKIKKGGYCSIHEHVKGKKSMFFVIQGNLKISVWNNPDFSDDSVLWAGDRCDVDCNIKHQFKALTDVECIEIYYAELDKADIVRHTTGGLEK